MSSFSIVPGFTAGGPWRTLGGFGSFGPANPMELASRIARQKSLWAEASFVTRNRERFALSDGISEEIERARRLLEGIERISRQQQAQAASSPSAASPAGPAAEPEGPSPEEQAVTDQQQRVDTLRDFRNAVAEAEDNGLVDLAELTVPEELRQDLEALEPAGGILPGLGGVVGELLGLVSFGEVDDVVSAALDDAEAALAAAEAALAAANGAEESPVEGGETDAGGGDGPPPTGPDGATSSETFAVANPFLASVLEAMEAGLARIEQATESRRTVFLAERLGNSLDLGLLQGGYAYDLAALSLRGLDGWWIDRRA